MLTRAICICRPFVRDPQLHFMQKYSKPRVSSQGKCTERKEKYEGYGKFFVSKGNISPWLVHVDGLLLDRNL